MNVEGRKENIFGTVEMDAAGMVDSAMKRTS